MKRSEINALIKEYNLQEKALQTFGKNYTLVSSAELEQLIHEYEDYNMDKLNEEPEIKEEVNIPKDTDVPDFESIENPYEAACVAFVGVLKDSGMLVDILAKL